MASVLLSCLFICLTGQLILNFCVKNKIIKHSILLLIVIIAVIAISLASGFWGEDGFFRGELIAAGFLMIIDCSALLGISMAHIISYIIKKKR